MTTNLDVKHQLVRARTGLIIDMPFFGELAIRLKLVENLDIPTLAVDGTHIFYNPNFVAKLSIDLTKAALGHEVMHCVYEHFGRRGDRDPKKWNMAGDYVINLVLQDSGFEIGKTWLLDPAYKDMTTDQVYNLLPNGPGKGPGESGGPLDEVISGDPENVQTDMTDWKIATIQAANTAKQQGKLPKSMARFIEELTAPKVDWREQLRRFVTERSQDDYTWMRPNRRFAAQDLYLPSAYSENMGEIVVAIDTSGSIDQATLNAFGSEIQAIVQNARPTKTTVIYCDAAVNHVDEFQPNDELQFAMHGGGGTDFRPPFKYVEKSGEAPACFIYLTDMYGNFPAHAPDYPVMWCATTDVAAPFGDTLRIEI